MALLLLVALVGCGDSGPKLVPVTGTLTYKGSPVTNAYIDFVPDKGRPSWAQTDEQGRFTVNYIRDQPGAVVGKHKLSVRMRPSTVEDQEAVMQGNKPRLSKDLEAFFEKYSAANSKVEVVIDNNTKELKLNWD